MHHVRDGIDGDAASFLSDCWQQRNIPSPLRAPLVLGRLKLAQLVEWLQDLRG